MNNRGFSALLVSTVVPFMLCGAVEAASEIKGAAILNHSCGKVAVKQMGLLHAGKFDEANKLSTKEMQDQWKAMPAKDRLILSAKDISAELQACTTIMCADGQVTEGMTV